MTENNSSTFSLTVPSDCELVMSRIFNGPPALVFKAWTDPAQVRQWWGLRGSTLAVCEIDLRPGGSWRYVQQLADGSEYGFSGEYREIESPNRLVYTEGYEAMPGHDYLVTLNFEEQDGRTKLTSTLLYQSKEDRDGHVQSGMESGARETYERLDEHLEMLQVTDDDLSEREFIMERVFDAPRSLVFEAYSSAEHLKHWWGPKGWVLPVCEVDFRPGGVWFYCMRGPAETDFMESWGKAVYQEIVEPERIVYIDMFVDSEGNKIPNMPEMEITVRFEEMDGKTKLISRTIFETAEELQAVIKMGVEQGITETFNRLDDYLEKAV